MKTITRSIQQHLKKDLAKKIVVLAGPRQCGKTTLAKNLGVTFDYLNYDSLDDRSSLLAREWNRNKELVIFDELHKMPKWKSWLKGIYDKEGNTPHLLVTGSARLDAFRKTGDSLAGRHYYYRLHPFDLKELTQGNYRLSPEKMLENIFKIGGYPEPFLEGDQNEYRRWRGAHLDVILRQDLADFDIVRNVQSIQLLVEMLRSKVSSGVSVNALATDLNKDPKTVQKWLGVLEDLFVIFKLTPYAKDISRSLKKEPKYYFYDTGFVVGDAGVKLENAVACSLLKETHRLFDCLGISFKLHYLKVKGGREIDFVLVPEDSSHRAMMIETKWADADASSNFKLFEGSFKKPKKIQLVEDLKKEFSTSLGVDVVKASQWLCDFDLTK